MSAFRRNPLTAALAAVAVWTLGCGGPPKGAGMGAAPVSACLPVTGSLAPDASLAGMAGRYRLVMRQGTGAQARSAEGTLSLGTQPEGYRELRGASTPLGGSVEIDLPAVGAEPVRELGTDDPAAPGVLVIERGDSGDRSIVLRLGSEANRRDVVAYDGAYATLSVTRIDRDGFAGSWRSGVRERRSTGYFCAWRSSDQP